jgi:hypothetical protein
MTGALMANEDGVMEASLARGMTRLQDGLSRFQNAAAFLLQDVWVHMISVKKPGGNPARLVRDETQFSP